MLGRRESGFGFANFVLRAVHDDDELAGFNLRFILNDALFGNPDAIKRRAHHAQTANYRRSFQKAPVLPHAMMRSPIV